VSGVIGGKKEGQEEDRNLKEGKQKRKKGNSTSRDC